MEGNDKKRIYITAGIIALILLLAVLMIALGGTKERAEQAATASGSEVSTDAAETASAADTEETDAATEASQTATEETATQPQGSGAERAATKVEIAPADTGASQAAATVATTAVQVKVPAEGYIFFSPAKPKLKDSYKDVAYDTEGELKTLLGYWEAKNLDAVRDLIALPRYEAITATLKGSNDFYYYGDRDPAGKPHGKGVAVYADNQYYYGDFANGVRSGTGEWLQRYPVYMKDVMIEHYYAGEWARDLPNGKGQDHYEYDENRMNEEQLFLLNAIGTFKDGVYDGEMYIMIEETDGSYTEWTGNCKEGTFEVMGESDDHLRIPILEDYNQEHHYIWVKPDKNQNFKVNHLIVP